MHENMKAGHQMSLKFNFQGLSWIFYFTSQPIKHITFPSPRERRSWKLFLPYSRLSIGADARGFPSHQITNHRWSTASATSSHRYCLFPSTLAHRFVWLICQSTQLLRHEMVLSVHNPAHRLLAWLTHAKPPSVLWKLLEANLHTNTCSGLDSVPKNATEASLAQNSAQIERIGK